MSASEYVVHGVCRECSRRTYLILPARWCVRCLERAVADEYEPPTPEQQLAVLEEIFGPDDAATLAEDGFELSFAIEDE